MAGDDHKGDDSPADQLTRDDIAYIIRARRRRARTADQLRWLRAALAGTWKVLRWLIKEGIPTGAVIIAGIVAWRTGEISKILALFL